MYKKKHLLATLQRITETLDRIITNSKDIDSYHSYYLTPAGMIRLESTCMLLIAVGESLEGVDKMSNKELLKSYPEIDWKGAMGLRDIIAHHYFDLDAEIVYDVVKNNIPDMNNVIKRIIEDLQK